LSARATTSPSTPATPRAESARREFPQAKAIVAGDLETIAGAKDIAAQVNALGHFDTVVHNAAVGYREGDRLTADAGVSELKPHPV
jgi:hypothetical protein